MAPMSVPQTATAQDYRLLGLKPGAPDKAVKRAYRDLAKKWHPDRFAQRSPLERAQAEEKFKRLQEAYRRILEHPLAPEPEAEPKGEGGPSPFSGGSGSGAAEQPRNGRKSPGATRPREAPKDSAGRKRFFGFSDKKTAGRAAAVFAAAACITAAALWGLPTGLFEGYWGSRTVPAPLPVPPAREPVSVGTPNLAERLDDALKVQRDLLNREAARPVPPLPGDAARKSSFTLGSSQAEVLAVQGPPDKKIGSRWTYGLSEVRFRDGRVVGYDNFDGRLRVSLQKEPPSGEAPAFFTLGSTQEEVLRVQGTPTSVRGDRWTYGFSEVRFRDGRVVSYDNYFGNLKIRLLPSPDAVAAGPAPAGFFTIGSTPDDVLAVQGTPTSIRGNVWFYEFADVLFRDGRVRWVNDPDGRLRFVPLEALSRGPTPTPDDKR
ncbi:DnaJ domain-containing protein [Desulfacinum infernum DSM 9756]|uniref:DnaJ domain-containing protein n=1 Tax=Desulfacinum infernum DSM 9756 TaxID=1121391 RepID=A0A1M5CUK4_9BACT|nr:J domain-containing protein [Desulfacinum infernum]SHF58430.1 DnaJ domain-containing protein [Desulfacinum infernum DSM 9756]